MQDGPRYLTDLDINTALVYTNLTPGAGGGTTNATNQTASGLSIDFTNLGQIGQTADGRRYRLCTFASATTVTPGTFVCSQWRNTTYSGLAVATTQPANTAFYNVENNPNSALAKPSVSFNVYAANATAVTADQFAGGFAEVIQNSGAGNGPVALKLAGNTAATSAGQITLYLADSLNVASKLVAGTDTVNLVPSPWVSVQASVTLAAPVGIVTVQVPNTTALTYAAWVQTRGEVLALEDSVASVLNKPLSQSTITAGDVTAYATASLAQPIGYALSVATSSVVAAYVNLD